MTKRKPKNSQRNRLVSPVGGKQTAMGKIWGLYITLCSLLARNDKNEKKRQSLTSLCWL